MAVLQLEVGDERVDLTYEVMDARLLAPAAAEDVLTIRLRRLKTADVSLRVNILDPAGRLIWTLRESDVPGFLGGALAPLELAEGEVRDGCRAWWEPEPRWVFQAPLLVRAEGGSWNEVGPGEVTEVGWAGGQAAVGLLERWVHPGSDDRAGYTSLVASLVWEEGVVP